MQSRMISPDKLLDFDSPQQFGVLLNEFYSRTSRQFLSIETRRH